MFNSKVISLKNYEADLNLFWTLKRNNASMFEHMSKYNALGLGGYEDV